MEQPACICSLKLIDPTTPKLEVLREKCQGLILSEEKLIEIRNKFSEDVEKGLRKQTNQTVPVECVVTFVQDLPDGSEEGKSLSIQFTGGDVEIVLLELRENHVGMWVKYYKFPIELTSGTELFEFFGECLEDFCKIQDLTEDELALGFVFGFPINQTNIKTGILKKVRNRLNYPDIVGKNVVTLLQEEIDKRELKLKISCILNNTTGILVSTAWKYPNCKIGLILGDISNMCYVEDSKNAASFNESNDTGKVVIDLEWSNFGMDGTLNDLQTPFEINLDNSSENNPIGILERITGGSYIGEMIRLTLVELIKEGLLFGGEGAECLSTPNIFLFKYVIDIESDLPGKTKNCCNVLCDLGLNSTKEDCINVRYICECYTRRLAAVTAACLAAIINKIKEPFVTIGIDGDIYLNHPLIHDLLMAHLAKLINTDLSFNIVRAKNASGRGGAITAVCAKRKENGFLEQQQEEQEDNQEQEPVCTETECE